MSKVINAVMAVVFVVCVAIGSGLTTLDTGIITSGITGGYFLAAGAAAAATLGLAHVRLLG